MTSGNMPAGNTSAPLAFSDAAVAAHAAVFGNFPRFVKLASLPIALTLILAQMEIAALFVLPFAEGAFLILDFAPYAVLGVLLNRVILLDGQTGALPAAPLWKPIAKYFGYSLLVVIILMIPMIAIGTIFLTLSFVTTGQASQTPSFNVGAWTVVLILIGLLFLLYLLARLSLVFPAIAVEHRMSLIQSWRITKGAKGRTLFTVYSAILVFVAILAMILSLVSGQNIHVGTGFSNDLVLPPNPTYSDIALAALPSLIISAILSYITFGLLVGAYAYAFSQLSTWSKPSEEVLQRFE